MVSEAREHITEWLTTAETCFLFGAGCSVCAGKPLIGPLTNKILKDAEEKLLQQFHNLKPTSARPATIEDLITYLTRYRDILGTVSNYGDHTITIDEIDKWLKEIKQNIVAQVDDDWQPSPYHQRFLSRLNNQHQRRARDIFSLNYDTLLEASLDKLRIPYVDGFRGANAAWFDAETFDETGAAAAWRIFKLHGSINWTRDSSGNVRRGDNANVDVAAERIVVYPSEQKYLQTQYGIYETLMGRFRNRLRLANVNNCLVVLGYSFNDEHINEAICDAVNDRGSNLTVIAFVGREDDPAKQDERLGKFSDRCDLRFNAFIGSNETGSFIGNAVGQEVVPAILGAGLWEFEKLVDFIAGE